MIPFSSQTSTNIEYAAELLRKAKYAVVLTGAGISTPSGIPDFRSEGTGLWSRDEPMEVASLNTFRTAPEKFYAWFRSLADVKNRRREPWVLEGLDYLHHPLRARASAGYVMPSLEMLWEIQKTGDIFFPKRWLDATLGGHSSPEVAGMVRAFLAGLPANYPERLKNITLQSADELFRVEAAHRR